jgi:cyclomaltodextrinase / maltogenic alpha-amylase / neopullulanase
MRVKAGQRYRHYKGGEYQVLTVGTHTENQKQYVIYTSEYDGRVWIRPASMFTSMVKFNGKKVRRFELIKEKRDGL